MDWETISKGIDALPETMNIYAQKGAKVKFAFPTFGYEYQQEKALKFLRIGSIYTVERTEVYASYTHVYLVEVPDIPFNSVHFEDEAIGERKC